MTVMPMMSVCKLPSTPVQSVVTEVRCKTLVMHFIVCKDTFSLSDCCHTKAEVFSVL